MDCHACPKSDAYPKLSQTECTVCLADSNGIVSGDKVFNILELLLGDKVFPCLCKLCQLRVGTLATLQEPFSTQEIFVHWCLLSWRIQFPYFIFNPKFFRLFKLYLSLCCRNLRLESWFVQCPTMHSLSDWKLLSKQLFISNSLFPWDLWTKHWKWIWM